MKPARWSKRENKLFPFQVGFTAPRSADVHGRMLHLPGYEHQWAQRKDNFHLLEAFVECMSNNGADVCGQVGSNGVHAGGKTPADIERFCARMADQYQTPLHMAGMCLVEGLRALNVEKIALNSVYYWLDWRDGIARTELGA
jgi:hypothetical protein